ncbi:MAG TPA: hypothetical protein DCO77_02040 [Nitrospiraceae bacterium]|nr:hypothetical protein [Nitrospiraceae bacterium]
MRRERLSLILLGLIILLPAIALMLFGIRPGIFVALGLSILLALFPALILWRSRLAPLGELLDKEELDSLRALAVRLRKLHQEIAEQKAEAKLRENLIEDLFIGMREGCLILDDELKILRSNPRTRDFLREDEVAGLRLPEVERSPQLLEAVRKVLSGGLPHSLQVENSRGVWEIRVLALSAGGLLVLMEEIGARQRAGELRRRFVQDLAHELRSPLTVIRTTVETLGDELPTGAAPRLVRQVERITRLTKELYELASIETGEMELHPELQELRPLLREIAGDFRDVAERGKIELRLEEGAEISWCFDRRALGRVLSNLVDNAVKYNRPGGWVRLSAQEELATLVLEVVDSGRGIPPAELGTVTQRFYRVDRARTPGEAGLGLGLAIVKHLVQRMGGEISLDSTEDVETRFRVILPKMPQKPPRLSPK